MLPGTLILPTDVCARSSECTPEFYTRRTPKISSKITYLSIGDLVVRVASGSQFPMRMKSGRKSRSENIPVYYIFWWNLFSVGDLSCTTPSLSNK